MMDMWISIFLSTLRVSTPLIFAAMGGIMSERAGVTNIALESFMIVGAFSAAATAHLTHSPLMGAGVAMLVGAFFAAIYALSVIQFRADQIVAGTAMNLLAMGTAPLASKALFDSTGSTPALELADRFHMAPLFAAFILVFVLHFWMRTTRSGLWHGFAGEHPEALSTAGIRVRAVRWWSVILSGALAGLGGMTLSIFLSSSYSRGMTAGRGFMALAALIFGKWKPIPTLIACLFFGFTDAMQIRLQGATLFGSEPIPVQFIQVLPYIITVFVLAGFVGKSRAPAKLGTPWLLVLASGALLLGGSGCKTRRNDAVPLNVSAQTIAEGNVSLVREMLQVVLLVKDPSPELLNPLASAAVQGASLEGLYNGLVNSRQYRETEALGTRVPAALPLFADALTEVQLLTANPWLMPKSATRAASAFQRPTGSAQEAVAATMLGWEHPSVLAQRDPLAMQKFYRTAFGETPFFTLKRVLGEAAMQVLAAAGTARPDVYADLTLRWNARVPQYGIAARASTDRSFHLRTAKSIPEDRLVWETLNRAHRIMNAATQEK